ncbi:MAG TPA: sensor histidine kinase [Rhizomicrobium sp.]|nr:sensor histidine kinase [Rhizomicrobium sp.]
MAALETHSQSAPHDLLSEANHRIANNLAVLLSTVQMKSANLAKGPNLIQRDHAREILHDIASKITSVGHLHRHLARRPDVPDLDVGNFLIESSVAIVASLALAGQVGIVQRLSTQCRVRPEQAQQLGLILSEILMNAIKHAHPTGVTTQIHIDCSPTADGGIAIEIGDDGIGLPEGFNPEKDGGMGFRLIRALAKGLGAKLRIESDSLGLSFYLLLPPQGVSARAANDLAI